MAGNITRNWPREIMARLSPIDRILIAAAGLLAPQLLAGQLAATTIEFAPRVTTQLQRYGSEEGDALRSAILAAVSRETGRLATPEGLVLTVLVQDVVPTHPTRGLTRGSPLTSSPPDWPWPVAICPVPPSRAGTPLRAVSALR
jgi:hypothetical protein